MADAADPAMEGEMDEGMEDMEGQDPEADEHAMDDDDEEGDGDGEKNEYVKKEYVANPDWTSKTMAATIAEVESYSVKNSR